MNELVFPTAIKVEELSETQGKIVIEPMQPETVVYALQQHTPRLILSLGDHHLPDTVPFQTDRGGQSGGSRSYDHRIPLHTELPPTSRSPAPLLRR